MKNDILEFHFRIEASLLLDDHFNPIGQIFVKQSKLFLIRSDHQVDCIDHSNEL